MARGRLAWVVVALVALAASVASARGFPAGSEPEGKSGPINYRSFTTTFAGSSGGTASCPKKYKVTGGGADFTDGDTDDAALTSIAPAFDTTGVSAKRGFTARGQVAGISQDLTIYAMCTKVKGLHLVKETATPSPVTFTTLMAKCPRKESVVGGGFFTTTGSDDLQASAPYDGSDKDSRPDDGWVARFTSGAVFGDTAATAICSRELKPKYASSSSSPATGEVARGVECPGNTSVAGGGAELDGAAGAFLHRSAPADISDSDTVPGDGWAATAFVSSGNRTLTVHAICLK